MRLFQAQTLYGDNSSPPPPPHFSLDRENTRLMPVYLNQYRDGRRLPTPEKVAVMELSNSFERRRLGKHQQILNDISQRCREQEVSDMSGKLSMKVNLHKYEKLGKEMTFYSTTFMDQRYRKAGPSFPEVSASSMPRVVSQPETNSEGPQQMFEKNYRSFPARRIMRQNSKFDFFKLEPGLPTVNNNNQTVPKSSVSDSHVLRSKFLQKQQVNGPIQMDHYMSPRNDLAPLVLPNLDLNPYGSVPQSERLDRMDTCFSTSRLTLGPRAKTQVSLNNHKAQGGAAITMKPDVGLGDRPGFNHEMSQLQLTSGHSPPPNSVQEIEPPAS